MGRVRLEKPIEEIMANDHLSPMAKLLCLMLRIAGGSQTKDAGLDAMNDWIGTYGVPTEESIQAYFQEVMAIKEL